MPGPKPKYRPSFSAAELEQARAVLRCTSSPYGHVRRAKLVVLLSEQPDVSSPEAGRRIGADNEFVKKWRRRWARRGFSLVDAPRSGRPRVFSPEDRRSREGHRVRAAG